MYSYAKEHHMNKQQEKAFMRAFTNRLTLIQGPPCTGKTETAAWIVDAFARLDKKILLTSSPNAAIDNVGKKLDATTLEKVARYIAESAEEKLDPSVLDLYTDRWFPKEAEKALRAQKYEPSRKLPKYVKKEWP